MKLANLNPQLKLFHTCHNLKKKIKVAFFYWQDTVEILKIKKKFKFLFSVYLKISDLFHFVAKYVFNLIFSR